MHRISMACPVFNGNEKKYLMECIDTGWVSANGRFVNEFEAAFAEICGTRYALSCANGTVSLHLTLLGLGIGPGDEVIMPALTYIATANCVRYCGATPVFVDSEESTFNMDVSGLENKITSRTRAIMPVHLYGLPCNMPEILRIARKHGLYVIEDAAEAFGAKIGEKLTGSFGDVASFSFFGNKIITSGEGGMVVTDNEELYKKIKLLKGQGMSADRRYWHEIVGYNYRMTNMQAAIGLGQLENRQWHLNERKRVARAYEACFSGMEDYVHFQSTPPGYSNVYWMTNIILTDKVRLDRDAVMAQMEANNVEMRPVFYPMHVMPPYFDPDCHLPVAEKLAARGISLPSHALLTQEDIRYVSDCIKKIIVGGQQA